MYNNFPLNLSLFVNMLILIAPFDIRGVPLDFSQMHSTVDLYLVISNKLPMNMQWITCRCHIYMNRLPDSQTFYLANSSKIYEISYSGIKNIFYPGLDLPNLNSMRKCKYFYDDNLSNGLSPLHHKVECTYLLDYGKKLKHNDIVM